MKTTGLLLCILALAFNPLNADDITLTNGRVLKNAEKLGIDVDTVRIQHDEGIAKVDAKLLPLSLQVKWQMTPEQVELRKQEATERKLEELEKERVQRELAAQRAKELRDSLTEAERVPRYIQASELQELMAGLTNVLPVEVKYIALRWNYNEANRVGLPEQAQHFSQELALLKPQLVKLEQQRLAEAKKLEEMNQKMDRLAQQSQSQVNQMQRQINDLKNDVNSAKSYTNTVIYKTPTYYNGYSSSYDNRPVIVRPPRPVYINQAVPGRKGVIYNGGRIPSSSGHSISRPSVQPAPVRPATVRPATVTPGRMTR